MEKYLLGYPTKRTDYSEYILTISTTCGSPTGCHCSPSLRRMTNWCDLKTNFKLPKLVRPKTLANLPSAPQSRTSPLPLEPPIIFPLFSQADILDTLFNKQHPPVRATYTSCQQSWEKNVVGSQQCLGEKEKNKQYAEIGQLFILREKADGLGLEASHTGMKP